MRSSPGAASTSKGRWRDNSARSGDNGAMVIHGTNANAAAHVRYEVQSRPLNELLISGRSEFSLGIEEFRDAAGNITSRHASGSLGLDTVLYERGHAAFGFDLKTGRAWSAAELAERERRFGIPVIQIKTR
jgi:hypothetical protein